MLVLAAILSWKTLAQAFCMCITHLVMPRNDGLVLTFTLLMTSSSLGSTCLWIKSHTSSNLLNLLLEQ